jgi:putative ABC transport system substrate-binding protein
LDEARTALISTLLDSGFVEGRNIRILYRNAQGEIPNINLILQSFRTAKVNLIVTVGTPCMVAAVQAIHDIPIVFTVAFSPEQIGLALTDSNVAGVYDPLDMEFFVEMIKSVLPSCQRIGLPFNPAEANSQYAAERLQIECLHQNLAVEVVVVASSNDVLQAAQSLSRKRWTLLL